MEVKDENNERGITSATQGGKLVQQIEHVSDDKGNVCKEREKMRELTEDALVLITDARNEVMYTKDEEQCKGCPEQ